MDLGLILVIVGVIVAVILVFRSPNNTPQTPQKRFHEDRLRREKAIQSGAWPPATSPDDPLFDDLDAEPWETVEVPPNRPEGKWVNWKHGSGWIKVRGTSYNADAITTFLCDLEDVTEGRGSLEITLTRDPDNRYDPNAIEVDAYITGPRERHCFLGHVERDAAAWLAETYSPDMPIAAELKKIRTNFGDGISITICGLMPAKKDRDPYIL